MEKNELFDSLQCALMHDLRVCGECKKCEGNCLAEIRLNLVDKLKEYMYGN